MGDETNLMQIPTLMVEISRVRLLFCVTYLRFVIGKVIFGDLAEFESYEL